jgi:sulfur-oxidizing protein SoxZ
MSDIGFVRIFAPAKVASGGPIRIRALITHPMDPVLRDAAGNVVVKEYVYVHTMRAYFDGEEILALFPGQSISTNPLFSFNIRVSKSGFLKVVFEDTAGGKYEGEKKIELA